MSNVFAIYNTQLKQVVQLVCDGNINEPWHDYPDCIKVPIDATVYGTLEMNQETYDFVTQCCEEVEAQMHQ